MKAWQFAAGDSLDFWISCCLSSFQSSQMRHGKLTCRKRSRSPMNLGPTENCRHRLQPAMKAMAEMVVALPNLERLECTNGDISADGLQEFSRVLAPKASTLKLKSIALSSTNLEGAAEDLGKAFLDARSQFHRGCGLRWLSEAVRFGVKAPPWRRFMWVVRALEMVQRKLWQNCCRSRAWRVYSRCQFYACHR